MAAVFLHHFVGIFHSFVIFASTSFSLFELFLFHFHFHSFALCLIYWYLSESDKNI